MKLSILCIMLSMSVPALSAQPGNGAIIQRLTTVRMQLEAARQQLSQSQAALDALVVELSQGQPEAPFTGSFQVDSWSGFMQNQCNASRSPADRDGKLVVQAESNAFEQARQKCVLGNYYSCELVGFEYRYSIDAYTGSSVRQEHCQITAKVRGRQ